MFIGAIILCERLARGQRRFHGNNRRHAEVRGKRAKGQPGLLANTACFIPLLSASYCRLLFLLRLVFLVGDAEFGHRYIVLVGNSVR